MEWRAARIRELIGENTMNTRSEIKTTFIELIQPFVREASAAESITDETRLIEDLKVNSARLVDIILETEDKFGIAIDDYSADGMRTVGDAVNVILAKRAAAA
jgi:acyl carrier protein